MKVLLIWPKFPPSYWGGEGVMEMIPERSPEPPLGLITVAALCPPTWTLRLLDHAFDEIRDEDYAWADLVMVSAMHAQNADTKAILARARELGKRTFLGGPWASSEPEVVRLLADHVMVGEAEEVFAEVAVALEQGTARDVYHVVSKPDMSHSPTPRFDLLKLEKYLFMSVQFSRGCPFECEFCDIITIYGRKPRLKSSAQLIAELEKLRELGWRKGVFIVDDNFIGNSNKAMGLSNDLAKWGKLNGRPFTFFTEASIDLADRPELIQAMVEANFTSVFIGIESPSPEALKETKKFQNLRRDNVEQIRVIQEGGLWVLAGFIVGFDSDDEGTFDRQFEFVEKTSIPYAMTGMLQAPPTSALFDRMQKEGRLLAEHESGSSNFNMPNFRTVMPLHALTRGYSRLLLNLYNPETYFRRALRSLEVWKPKPSQKGGTIGLSYRIRVLLKSMWVQGIRSDYRGSYWRFLWTLMRTHRGERLKLNIGMQTLLSAHHFITYSREIAGNLAAVSRGEWPTGSLRSSWSLEDRD